VAKEMKTCELLLTTSEVAREVGVERTTIWRLMCRHPELGFRTWHGYRLLRNEELAVVRRLLSEGM
jgi:hypothetical protein